MNQIRNKHILNKIALKKPSLDAHLEPLKDPSQSGNTGDLLSELRMNLFQVFQAEEHLNFMISEVTAILKKKL